MSTKASSTEDIQVPSTEAECEETSPNQGAPHSIPMNNESDFSTDDEDELAWGDIVAPDEFQPQLELPSIPEERKVEITTNPNTGWYCHLCGLDNMLLIHNDCQLCKRLRDCKDVHQTPDVTLNEPEIEKPTTPVWPCTRCGAYNDFLREQEVQICGFCDQVFSSKSVVRFGMSMEEHAKLVPDRFESSRNGFNPLLWPTITPPTNEVGMAVFLATDGDVGAEEDGDELLQPEEPATEEKDEEDGDAGCGVMVTSLEGSRWQDALDELIEAEKEEEGRRRRKRTSTDADLHRREAKRPRLFPPTPIDLMDVDEQPSVLAEDLLATQECMTVSLLSMDIEVPSIQDREKDGDTPTSSEPEQEPDI